jgi:hypothetical protein
MDRDYHDKTYRELETGYMACNLCDASSAGIEEIKHRSDCWVQRAEAAETEVVKLRDALGKYADEANWEPSTRPGSDVSGPTLLEWMSNGKPWKYAQQALESNSP